MVLRWLLSRAPQVPFTRKKCFLLMVLFCIGTMGTTFILFIARLSNPPAGKYAEEVACHTTTNKSMKGSLPNIMEFYPKKNQSIFFHDTSCNSYSNGKIVINARQACAVESAAHMNPRRQVYLLYASPGGYINQNTESDRLLQVLMELPNVKIFHVDLDSYFKGTPLEDLWNSGALKNSDYPMTHTSDVLRYLTLWKYGGIYLDLDVIVIKSLDDLGTNYAGIESIEINSAVLSISDISPGREYAEMCLAYLAEYFNGGSWAANGNGIITRLYKDLCSESIRKETGSSCKGFTFYSQTEFYAIPYWHSKYFCSTKPEILDRVISLTRNSYVIHTWNYLTASCTIPKNLSTPYMYFAEKFCPRVVSQLDKKF